MSCDRSSKSTTSQASGGGLWPCDGLDGPAPHGRRVVPVNRSAARGGARRKPTTGTSGLFSEPSSPSADLQRSLESRLRQALAGRGSAEYVLTWKHWDIGLGPPICALRASGHRTSGSGFGGLPTPSGVRGAGRNHVAGRLDEWGGSSNPFRGTSLGRVHCPGFELWMMGFPEAWWRLMPREMPSSPKSRRRS
jgi:hypothetical protein